MNKLRILAVGCLVVTGIVANGAIIIGNPETFDTGVGSWVSDLEGGGGDSTVSLTTATPGPGGSVGDDYLQISYNYGGPPLVLSPVISNTFHTGDYTALGGIVLSFDFFAAGPQMPAASPSVFLQTESGGRWTAPFTYGPSLVGTWVNISISVSPDLWTGGVGSFLTAIKSVTAVGILMEGNAFAGGTQMFGIDNWNYYMPEPGTMCLLAAAFLSLGITFRRPLSEALTRKETSA